MKFKAIFSLAVIHAYHGGRWSDVEWLLPAETTRRLRRARMVRRAAADRLYIFAADDESCAPLAARAGLRLRFGLRPMAPDFWNYTLLPADFPAKRALYRNAAARVLDAAQGIRLVGTRFNHRLADPAQAATMVLKDGQGQVLKSEQIPADTRLGWSCELGATATGCYTVEETSGGNSVSALYYVDNELTAAGALAVVEIDIDATFWTTAPEFAVTYAAREETLHYYVVAPRYPDAEWASLTVADTGSAADGRPTIDFDKVESGALTAADVAPDLIGPAGAKVALFRSHSPVPRTARGRTGIQLKRGAEVVVAHLPQPAPDNASANLFVCVEKP